MGTSTTRSPLTGSEEQRSPVVRLLGPYDPYLQLRDRELLVEEQAERLSTHRDVTLVGVIEE